MPCKLGSRTHSCGHVKQDSTARLELDFRPRFPKADVVWNEVCEYFYYVVETKNVSAQPEDADLILYLLFYDMIITTTTVLSATKQKLKNLKTEKKRRPRSKDLRFVQLWS